MIQVLIAEDEALMRMGIRFCLDQENSGYELVGEAENGRQALEMCLKYKPQILITDIKMPVMDGIELIRQIKAHRLDIKIIILTCYEEFSYLHEAMHLGVDDDLLKVALKPERLREVLDGIRDKYFRTGDDPAAAAGESRLDALESIVMGYIEEPDEIARLCRTHRLDLDFDRYAVMLIESEDDGDLRSYHQSSALSRGTRAMLADCIRHLSGGPRVPVQRVCSLHHHPSLHQQRTGDGAPCGKSRGRSPRHEGHRVRQHRPDSRADGRGGLRRPLPAPAGRGVRAVHAGAVRRSGAPLRQAHLRSLQLLFRLQHRPPVRLGRQPQSAGLLARRAREVRQLGRLHRKHGPARGAEVLRRQDLPGRLRQPSAGHPQHRHRAGDQGVHQVPARPSAPRA